MHSRVKSIVANSVLSLVTLLLLLLVLEFVVFRFILVASDSAVPDYVDGIVRYRPLQQGVYRVKNEIEAEFRINSNGWNSAHPEYAYPSHTGFRYSECVPRALGLGAATSNSQPYCEERQQRPGVRGVCSGAENPCVRGIEAKEADEYRIAIIGDSYIAAFQVPYDRSLAERLESKLDEERFQVYRFGIDGAPLSHYLHMLRREVLGYAPDLVIVNLVHNDFDESYRFKPGVYASSFMKLKIEEGAVSEELEPLPYQAPWYNWVRESATWRYLAYRQQIRFGALRELILGGNGNGGRFRANIDLAALEQRAEENRIATDYLFRQLKAVCDANGADLLLLIDGDRQGIYEDLGKEASSPAGVLGINRMAASVAAQYGIEFLDLHGVFQEDYAKHAERFEFVHDSHWNAYAHDLVAERLAGRIGK